MSILVKTNRSRFVNFIFLRENKSAEPYINILYMIDNLTKIYLPFIHEFLN